MCGGRERPFGGMQRNTGEYESNYPQGGIIMTRSCLSALILLMGLLSAHAADGFTVNVDYSGWDGGTTEQPFSTTYLDEIEGPLKLYRHDIENNAVVNTQIICNDACAYPAINLEGTKVAFYRRDASNNWHISVVNKDGSGLDDLADVSSNISAALEWPQGDWVHYYKKDNPQEIWKVNVKTKEKSKAWAWEGTHNGPSPSTVRFTMTADGQACAYRSFGEANMAFNCYPPKADCAATPKGDSYGYRTIDGDKYLRIQSCNIQVTPSGNHLFSYINNRHAKVDGIHDWNRQTNVVTKNAALGLTRSEQADGLGYKSSMIRAVSNSDKWYIEMIISNPTIVISDWVGRQAFVLGEGFSSGDFWVKPPAGKEGMIELTDGSWISPGDPTSVRNPGHTVSNARPRTNTLRREIVFTKGSMKPVIHLNGHRQTVDFKGRTLTKTK